MIQDSYRNVGYKKSLLQKPLIVEESEIVIDPSTENYKSLYRFDDSIKSLPALGAIPRGTKFYADYLAFDIDDSSLEKAYLSMQKLTEWMLSRDVSFECWFSGSKGFHVMVPTCQFSFEPTDNEDQLKQMALNIASNCGIEIDNKIYNASRIFRMPGSINQKSGLYKVPVTALQEYNEDALKKWASKPRENNYPEPDDYGTNDILTSLYRGVTNTVKVNRTIMPSEDPKETRLFAKVQEGDRNSALYKLARKLARRSIGEQDALRVCGWWASSLQDPMSEKEITKTVLSAYTKGVNELVDETNMNEHFFDAKRCLTGVKRLITNLNKNVVKTGFEFIDNYTMGLYKGDVVFIIARPGNFKTCILSSILRSTAQKTGGKSLLFSMEMAPDRLSLRHMQASEGMNQLEVIEAVKSGHKFPKFKEEFKDVVVIGLSSLSIEMIIGLIDYYLEEYGEISSIGFDYLSLLNGCANNTEQTSRFATELKTRVAKAAKCVVFCLVQAKRIYEGDGGDVEIDRQAGKDSSSIEDSADYMLGLWKHQGDNYGRFLKSRAFNSTKYTENPYFKLSLNKPHMKLNSIHSIDGFEAPSFKQVNHKEG